jgi:hypothetical protein
MEVGEQIRLKTKIRETRHHFCHLGSSEKPAQGVSGTIQIVADLLDAPPTEAWIKVLHGRDPQAKKDGVFVVNHDHGLAAGTEDPVDFPK